MISQILIYGLFISEIKDQNFFLDLFFFGSLSWALKNKGVRFMVRGCKFVLRGVQNNFFFLNYIYIYFESRGSFEPLDHNVSPPLPMVDLSKFIINKKNIK